MNYIISSTHTKQNNPTNPNPTKPHPNHKLYIVYIINVLAFRYIHLYINVTAVAEQARSTYACS